MVISFGTGRVASGRGPGLSRSGIVGSGSENMSAIRRVIPAHFEATGAPRIRTVPSHAATLPLLSRPPRAGAARPAGGGADVRVADVRTGGRGGRPDPGGAAPAADDGA